MVHGQDSLPGQSARPSPCRSEKLTASFGSAADLERVWGRPDDDEGGCSSAEAGGSGCDERLAYRVPRCVVDHGQVSTRRNDYPLSLSSSSATLSALNPHLQLPYTLQWNVALEQALGAQQTITVSYVGAAGRRLIQSAYVVSPNPSFGNADLVGGVGTSDYDALQVQFQRRLAHGLQALASYTWSHSIDTASAGSTYNGSNSLVPSVNPSANRGPSDFDIRNAFSTGVTYDIPAVKGNLLVNAALRGWSLQSVIQARSAPPVNVFDGAFSTLNGGYAEVRPELFQVSRSTCTGRNILEGR